ncbi:MAG TPA: molybdopterin-dependent oxidoreductase [Dehalococcoidia bacterium]|nr:molybdopterin-dependent oxidoreductase [Dehalococcoidia bacterium]
MNQTEEKIIKSCCRTCHGGCGVLVHVRDGRVTKVEGDPECPINWGSMCAKGLSVIQMAYHPDRLLYPQKRVGKKGEGKWQRISWDEALDTIATKLMQIKADYGAESIVLSEGTGRDYEPYFSRYQNLLGTPNLLSAGFVCYVSRIAACRVIAGDHIVADFDGNPNCVMVWANQVTVTNADEYKGEGLNRALAAGAKLIVVDPRLTYLASRADVWLQLRPGSDAALAYGMANVIIEEGLYDRDFVERYTHGWDEFAKRAKEYTPEKVAEITWVPAEKTREAARLYAQTKPAAIMWGVPIENTSNCTDNNRILAVLMAITGNIDIPGGNVFYPRPPIRNISSFALFRMLPPEQFEKQLGGDRFKLAHYQGQMNTKVVWDAILTGKPYPVKALQIHGSNPLITRADARYIYKALSQLEFMVVADFFMTPTAELADIVLPVATWLEMDWVADTWKRHGYALPRRKAVEIGECWPDAKMFNELGKRMGQEEHWWDNWEDGLDYWLEPAGLTWEQFKEMDYLKAEMVYRKHEEKGFRTPTKKFEIWSTQMEEWGYDPLPDYRDVPESPFSKPEMLKEYPYVLTAGARSPVFFHSEHRMIPWLREIHPDPIVEIHPETASKHGVKEGDWVYIESPRGRIQQRARITPGIDPRVVAIQHGWWFPEIKTPDHGWDRSNCNILTENSLETCDQAMGSTNLRVLLCKIYPVNEKEAC